MNNMLCGYLQKKHGLLIALLLMPAASWAAESIKSPLSTIKHSEAIATSSPLTVLLGLLVVVGLIFFLAWLIKHFNKTGFMANQHMKVVSTLSLGTREKAMLIEVGDKQILIGVAPGSINALHVFDEKVVITDAEQPHDFANKLKQFIHKQQKPSTESPKP
ncbi:flagellar biosynthetic protein FliO [Dasania marina]|uniref:flagellar biosynthetic protein FliO n=1 Tax=Dasania marina TaxID=471499 RepID=UPI0030D9FC34|tara:strand:+ start:4647 stop:5129 length:483 start_codon:yes stop_codon:yes gene_type:complete